MRWTARPAAPAPGPVSRWRAGFCAAAIGTETDGSIMSPSAMNGVVGIKPSIGLVGRSGIIPISHSQDTAGPIARSVADAALVLNAIAGVGPPTTRRPPDAGTRAGAGTMPPILNDDGLRGARIGVLAATSMGSMPMC